MPIARSIVFLLLALAAGPLAQAGEAAAVPTGLEIRSSAALIVDEQGNPLYAKQASAVKPIASITKLMTAMLVLDSGVSLDERVTIRDEDRDRLRYSRSRLRPNEATLTRRELLTIALMSSENRAASALGRTTFVGGTPVFVREMNRKAWALGMRNTRFADASGLDGANRSTAEDLVKLVRAAATYPMIRAASTLPALDVHPYASGETLPYRNTNPLTRNETWQIEVSKTGYLDEAGRCLVMSARVADRPLTIVLLDAAGKLTPVGDSNRLRKWLASR